MFVLFLKISENAVPLATGQVLAELPKFKPDFLVDVQSTPCLPHKILHNHCFISPLGTTLIPRRNLKQGLCKMLVGKL